MSNVRDFGAVGDGKMDDTEAIQHAVSDGDGELLFPRGIYRITRPIVINLQKQSRHRIDGSGGVAKVVMAGKGPAFSLIATHAKTADPGGFRPEEWVHERMPTVNAIEIEGAHAEADGIRIQGVMQPTLTNVLIRKVRTAVHITDRARNLIISHCHFYHNTGIGLHLDRVNLHQAIVTGSHISYCRLGGIRCEDSEIRNFQITGNDIEYNNNKAHKVADADDIATAEIYIDVRNGSIREGTICSNTIQATASPNGSNIRFIGKSSTENHKAGMWTISGNLIGSQTNNVHLTSARGITITGNYIYSGHHRNLLIEHCRNMVIGDNCFGHNPDYNKNELCTGVRLQDSTDCVLNGNLIQDCQAGKHTVPNTAPIQRQGLLELVRCHRLTMTGSQIVEGAPYGLYVEDCTDTLINACTILDDRQPKLMKAAIHWKGKFEGSQISNCRLHSGSKGSIAGNNDVPQVNNLVSE